MRTASKKTICALLAALCLLAGCGSGAAPGEEELPEIDPNASGGSELAPRQAADHVFSLNFDPEAGVNPIRAASAANMQFWSLLYDSVFTVDDDFSVSSEVVTAYRTEDYVWWVFDVDTSITFSDGTPLTAADVAYSIRSAQQSSYYSGRLNCIYGASALDDGTFAITAAQANSQLPAMLNIPIVKRGDAFEAYPAGTGPYMLNEDRSALVPNPESRHAGELPVDAVYLKDFTDTGARIAAFEDSSLDIVTNDPTGMYNLGYGSSNETRYFDTTNMHYIGFNTRSNFFQTNRTRCAVAYLVDRDYVVDTLMHGCGVPAALPVHPKTALYDEEEAARYIYDPEAAEALFRQGGVDDLDGDGALEILVTGIIVELKIKFIVNNDSTVKVQAARRLAEDLNALGITTTLYELSWDDYMNALIAGDYDMYYGELRLGADWNLGSLFAVPDSRNRELGLWYMNYARTMDARYSELYAAYLAAPEAERAGAFREAARYIGDSGFLIPICFERREVLTHRDVVGGIRATQYDLFNHFSEWTITLE